MTDPYSPLHAYTRLERGNADAGNAGVWLAASTPTLLCLRGDPADPYFTGAVEEALGLYPPTQPNTVSDNAELALLWAGPDEWRLLGAAGQGTALENRLRWVLADLNAAAVDLSGGELLIRIGGPQARTALAKGCTLDLHPRVFTAGQCARTRLAQADVLLWPQPDAIDLLTARSLAEYVWLWLEEAAAEYGFAVHEALP